MEHSKWSTKYFGVIKYNITFVSAPPPPSHQLRNGGSAGGNGAGNGGSVANSTSTSSSSSSNNESPIKEIPSIGSTNYSRVSHSVSVPLNLFHVMQKPSDLDTSLPSTNRSDLDASRYVGKESSDSGEITIFYTRILTRKVHFLPFFTSETSVKIRQINFSCHNFSVERNFFTRM